MRQFPTSPELPAQLADGAALRTAAGSLARTTFREGYAIGEVDAFLVRASTALDEHRRSAPLSLTPDEVLDVTFRATKFREGYDQDQVDDLLDQIVSALTA